ncbi:MAG: hypothetical protein JW723_07700 [Bacteroidales bacterium]|nr:hypothetical protein [Bacteroidales bacterium]
MIEYYPHNSIDKEKWDDCIAHSANEFIYAYSWYLDRVIPGWDAIILDDYRAVMPVTRAVKFGIKYIYPPLFTQQLGIFSPELPSEELAHEFLSLILSKYKYARIQLNEFNTVKEGNAYHVRQNNNHEIDLSFSYEELFERFNRNCKRNIKKAENCGLEIRSDLSAVTFVEFVRSNLEDRMKQMKREDYQRLANLTGHLLDRASGELYGCYSSEGVLCGTALFLITENRCIFSVCASSFYGKQCQAMYLLVNNQIRKYAGSKKIFDFSGSNLPGIAYFNSTFGSEIRHYPVVIINQLPWPLRLFKKQV